MKTNTNEITGAGDASIAEKVKQRLVGEGAYGVELKGADAKKACEEFERGERVKWIWLFLEKGWLKEAVSLIDETVGWKPPEGVANYRAWSGVFVSSGRDYQSARSWFHAWARGAESEHDETFLKSWMAHYGDVDASKITQKYNEWKSSGRLNELEMSEDSPLEMAANCGNWGKVALLMKYGADLGRASEGVVSRVSQNEPHGRTQYIAILEEMLKHPSAKQWVNRPMKSRQQETPLARFVVGDLEVEEKDVWIKRLLDAGADINAKYGHDQRTVLHEVMGWATHKPYRSLAQKLVKLGASLSETNNAGNTPIAVWKARVEMFGDKTAEYKQKAALEEKKWFAKSMEQTTGKQNKMEKITRKGIKPL